MAKTQQEEIKELIEAYQRRLHPLRVRQAQQGINTDPAVINEIADIEAKLEEL